MYFFLFFKCYSLEFFYIFMTSHICVKFTSTASQGSEEDKDKGEETEECANTNSNTNNFSSTKIIIIVVIILPCDNKGRGNNSRVFCKKLSRTIKFFEVFSYRDLSSSASSFLINSTFVCLRTRSCICWLFMVSGSSRSSSFFSNFLLLFNKRRVNSDSIRIGISLVAKSCGSSNYNKVSFPIS